MRFSFAGVEYEGRAGETLAAALVRNGVLGGFRSIYLDRPRGVFSADEQEPNALVQIGAEPMLRATLVELEDGLEASRSPGKGRLVAPPDGAVRRHARALRRARRRRRALGSRGRGAATRARRCCSTGGCELAEGDCGYSHGRSRSGSTRPTTSLAVERGRRRGTSGRSGSCSRPARSSGPSIFPNNDRPG